MADDESTVEDSGEMNSGEYSGDAPGSTSLSGGSGANVLTPSEIAQLLSQRTDLEKRATEAERKLTEVLTAYKESLSAQDEFRQRLNRDLERRVTSEIGKTCEGLISVLDDLERALVHAEESVLSPAPAAGVPDTGSSSEPGAGFMALIDGVRLVRDRFLAALRERGVDRIETVGAPFDPAHSEALQMVEVTDPALDGVVVSEIHAGYFFRGQLIRPARVLVGRMSPEAQA